MAKFRVGKRLKTTKPVEEAEKEDVVMQDEAKFDSDEDRQYIEGGF